MASKNSARDDPAAMRLQRCENFVFFSSFYLEQTRSCRIALVSRCLALSPRRWADRPGPRLNSSMASSIFSCAWPICLVCPNPSGRMHGLLFASARPLTFQDTIERLNMSKGSANPRAPFLREIGAIKLVYIAGDRRDHFVPETEFRALISGLIREKIQPHLEGGLARIESLNGAIGRSSGFGNRGAEDVRLLRKRIEKLRAWHKERPVSLSDSRQANCLIRKIFILQSFHWKRPGEKP